MQVQFPFYGWSPRSEDAQSWRSRISWAALPQGILYHADISGEPEGISGVYDARAIKFSMRLHGEAERNVRV